MIIVTGPGRSGTSLIAQVYKELGFDPGGEWVDAIQGGLEPPDVVSANEDILNALGLTPMGVPGGGLRRIRRAGKAVVPPRFRAAAQHHLRRLPWMGRAQPGMLRWERFEEVVDSLRPRLHAVAGQYEVTKDPRFLWTLPVWCAAGVGIEHVLISVRNLDATVQSRGRMGSIRFTTESGPRNSVAYGLGLSMVAALEYRVPHAIVRFPDFLDRPGELFRAARFPRPVAEADFVQVMERLARPELVHDRR